MGERPVEIHIADSYGAVDPAEWDALVGDGSPFLEHAFLWGLERLGCATAQEGWTPRPVLVRHRDRLVAAAPAWVKRHSMGEFVYDHGWANAAQRAGYHYYPKLVVAVPFTPVTGRRLLVHPDEPDPALRTDQLLVALGQAAGDCHGLHLLFNPGQEAQRNDARGLFPRLQFQFHWINRGYTDFDDWLGQAFRSKSRKNIRRERRSVAEAVEIEVVTQPDPDLVATMHRFYTRTCAQFGPWGRVYLTPEFFDFLAREWSHRLVLVVARRNGTPVGGSFNVIKGDRLYGRYWGCSHTIPFLHFEVCYYRPVAWCIAKGIQVFEPGHGGGHKYRRGFRPQITWSSHRLADPRLNAALKDHAHREAEAVRAEVEHLDGRLR